MGVRVHFVVDPQEASPERSRDFLEGHAWDFADGVLDVRSGMRMTRIASFPVQHVRYVERIEDTPAE